MNTWLIVRVALVALSLVQGALTNEVIAPLEGVSASLLLAIFAFGVVGMLFVVGIQRVNHRSAAVWRYPSWSICPFLLREPLQFFHFGGFFLIAAGVGGALRMLVLGQSLLLSLLFIPTYGVGILAGVYVCTVVYRSKMERPQQSAPTDVSASPPRS